MKSRKKQAESVRQDAAGIAASRPHPRHHANGDELRYRRNYKNPQLPKGGIGLPSYIANYTKGLPHDVRSGWLLDPRNFAQFVQAMDQSDTTVIDDLPLGPDGYDPINPKWESSMANSVTNPVSQSGKGAALRAWESMSAGRAFDLQGPDAQAVTIPPAPELCSEELAAEMTEVYMQALMRDVPFVHLEQIAQRFELKDVLDQFKEPLLQPFNKAGAIPRTNLVEVLAKMPWFANSGNDCEFTDAECKRRRTVTPQNLFRGIAPGDEIGPYLSQFLLIGNAPLGGGAFDLADGLIQYGAVTVDQRVRDARNIDFMTTWEQFVDAQNAADMTGVEEYEDTNASVDNSRSGYRFMATPRDLATYVHYDALYEAYLNACLILLGMGMPFDPGIPFGDVNSRDKQQGFATFGGPHILSLVTEVATRALKAVRYQKFNVHRRLRPEAVGGLVDRYQNTGQDAKPMKNVVESIPDIVLEMVQCHNQHENMRPDRNVDPSVAEKKFLLPMAYPEGSPMHPAYGAGHATVAGACVTILKAWFDHGALLCNEGKGFAYVPEKDGSKLVDLAERYRHPKFGGDLKECPLTVEGELNKLASNISIGRNWAGVHFFSDYVESFCLGEQIALGILEEQKLTYGENFSMTVPLFDGTVVRI